MKAIRLLNIKNIKYAIGLVCGHLKSKKYTYFLAEQLGIKEIRAVNYRKKNIDRPASDYDTEITDMNGDIKMARHYYKESLLRNSGNIRAIFSWATTWMPRYLQNPIISRSWRY